ncbi:MAG: hypothetical protein ACLR76_02255 [Alistipes sp.]
MTRREIWDTVYGAAASAYEPREARAVAALVCEDRLGLRFTDVIVEPDAPCPLRDDLQRLAFEIRSYRPAQYIADSAAFAAEVFPRGGRADPRPKPRNSSGRSSSGTGATAVCVFSTSERAAAA